MADPTLAVERASQRNALLAGFLGWTFVAFDFFLLTFVLAPVAEEFHVSRPEIALTLTGTLMMRPVGAFLFGLLADRYGRRLPLMFVIFYYSALQVLSGLAPNYTIFLILRLLYGIGMGGEWGVGASLTIETVSPKWRGLVSGLVQEGYAFGYLLAAIAYALVFPAYGWRVLFFVGGLPALLALFIRGNVQEPAAWHESRTDWITYRRSIFQNWRRFLYLVGLMAMMNFISHGTQDMYPTFLQQELHFSPSQSATVTVISMIGALCGGLLFGHLSQRLGRRRAMVTAVLLAALVIPLWILSPNLALVSLGAFLMQFMVQGAWGVIPAHINELSPNKLRGFFPGFAYQIGVLLAASITYIESLLGEHFTYAQSMGLLAGLVLLVGSVVIWAGPEKHGAAFGKAAEIYE